jgi:MFS family permease
MVMATTLAMVVAVFPPQERGKALGIAIASVYAGISCGPFLGGLLVSELNWRWIFYLCVPLGATTFLITCAKLRGDWADARGEPFDWRGSLIYAAALLLLIGGASQLDRGAWAGGAAIAGLAGIALFLAVEARTPYPILNIALLRDNRVFAFSSLAALFNYAATFGVTFFLSLYLQYVKGLSAREAGTLLVVQPLVQTALSPFCGRLADRYPAGRVATVGMALCAVGLACAATLSAGTPLLRVLAVLVLLGTGFALFSSPNVSVIMGSVPPRHLGVASGLNSSMRTLGMMTSMTIITVIFAVLMAGQPVTAGTQPQFLMSMRTALLVFCALCGLGIACSAARLARPVALTDE